MDKLTQLHRAGSRYIHNEGKIPLHAQRELLLGVNGVNRTMLELQGALQKIAESGHKAGEDIAKVLAVADLASSFLIESGQLEAFRAFVREKTGQPAKSAGLLTKIKLMLEVGKC